MATRAARSALLLGLVLLADRDLLAQDACQPTWLPFGSSLNAAAWDFEPFADGSGSSLLVAAGQFTQAGGVSASGVAAFDGTAWSPLGTGLDGAVLALEVFGDGDGRDLHAGGVFQSAGGAAVSHVARWDGALWQPLGPGLDGAVYALAAHDDGSGPALYAAGDFTQAGAVLVPGIARWDGAAWSPVGGGGLESVAGLPGHVRALAVFDDGTGAGPQLYAGGDFQFADGQPVNCIARWDGAAWHPLGGGLGGTPVSNVWALGAFDVGAGPRLYVGGEFFTAGDVPARRIAAWDGTSWSALGEGLDGTVFSLHAHDDGTGSGPALYVGGAFGTYVEGAAYELELIARWNGWDFEALGLGLVSASFLKNVEALATYDAGDGLGRMLVVGGLFSSSGGIASGNVARWGGCMGATSPWSNLGSALAGTDGEPELVGGGLLAAGSAGALVLSHAKPDAVLLLCLALSSTPAPFKGGVLVPAPVQKVVASWQYGGVESFSWTSFPAGVPSGTTLYLQYAIDDPAAVQGVALSNALLAVTP